MSINIAKSQSAGQREFKGKEFLDLRTFPEGKFRDQLKASLAERRAGVFKIKASRSLSKTQQDNYLRAFKTYVEYFTSDDRIVLSEKKVFYLAAVAYKYKDLLPLQRLDEQFNKLSDNYFWLYLASEPEIFFPIMEVEMFRRRTKTDLMLSDLTAQRLKLRDGPRAGTISGMYEVLHQSREMRLIRRFSGVFEGQGKEVEPYGFRFMKQFNVEGLQLNIVESNPEKMMGFYSNDNEKRTKLVQVLIDIIEAGGIIAGGFPNSLIYPSYHAVEMKRPNIISDRGTFGYLDAYELEFYDYTREDSPDFQFDVIHYNPLRDRDEDDDQEGVEEYEKIPHFWDIVEYFHAQDPSIPLEKKPVVYQQLADDVFDLEDALKQTEKYLRVIDGKLYRIYYNRSPDVDIFFTGPDHLAKYQRVYDILLQSQSEWPFIKFGEHVTTFGGPNYGGDMDGRLDFTGLKFQLIKRAYNSDREVLAGFDLDSSRSWLYHDDANGFSVRGTDSYIISAELGINTIVPSRQSSTFNRRLLKYQSRGFQPFLPGNIIAHFDLIPNVATLEGKAVVRKTTRKNRTTLNYVMSNYYGLVLQLSDSYNYVSVSTRMYDYFYTEEEREEKKQEDGEDVRDLKSTYHVSEERIRAIESGEIEPDSTDIILINDSNNRLLRDSWFKAREIYDLSRQNEGENSFQEVEDLAADFRQRFSLALEEVSRTINEKIGMNFWITVDPMTQFTGSFDPTKVPYLTSDLEQAYAEPRPLGVAPEQGERAKVDLGAVLPLDRLVGLINRLTFNNQELYAVVKECRSKLRKISFDIRAAYSKVISLATRLRMERLAANRALPASPPGGAAFPARKLSDSESSDSDQPVRRVVRRR